MYVVVVLYHADNGIFEHVQYRRQIRHEAGFHELDSDFIDYEDRIGHAVLSYVSLCDVCISEGRRFRLCHDYHLVRRSERHIQHVADACRAVDYYVVEISAQLAAQHFHMERRDISVVASRRCRHEVKGIETVHFYHGFFDAADP